MGIEKNIEIKTLNQVVLLEINERVNNALTSKYGPSEKTIKILDADYQTLNSIEGVWKQNNEAQFLINNLIIKLRTLLEKED